MHVLYINLEWLIFIVVQSLFYKKIQHSTKISRHQTFELIKDSSK